MGKRGKRHSNRNSGKRNKAWVISVNMGYGHQRAAYPLKDIAYQRIITANSDKVIGAKEKKLWRQITYFYEWISRMTSFPVVGKFFFNIYDKLQYISPYYPFRDLSKPNFTVSILEWYIKKGLCRSVIEYIKKDKLPIISTHFIPALAADYAGLKNIFCVVTDTDINRTWIARDPKRSNITYLSPTLHTKKRLLQYGVPEKKIILTGFPLPKENIGGIKMSILEKDLGERLANLDPNKNFVPKYKGLLKQYLGSWNVTTKKTRPVTVTFAIGGAGAQKELAVKIMRSMKKRLLDKEAILNLVAGTRLEIAQYIRDEIDSAGLMEELNKSIFIITELDKKTYFEKFNQALRKTDILWTKPSELCFYSALGIPIIISDTVGAHEVYNKTWLIHHGLGIVQEDPNYAGEWLFDWVNDGRLAETAWKGYWHSKKMGTYNIERVVMCKSRKGFDSKKLLK